MLPETRKLAAYSLALAGLALPPLLEAAGNTGLAINGSGRIDLVSSTPISYLNRGVADGRRTLQLRVAQPVLCADFATPPGGAVNPVGLQIIDPNGDSSGLLFGGISNYEYFTNGAAPSLFRVTSGTALACCVMLPANNASCVQGPNGGIIPNLLFADGFETLLAVTEGSAADLRVQLTGPAFVTPGGSLAYTVTVANIGGASVSGVRVREFYPKATGGFPVSLQGGSWTCTPSGGANCGTANGAGQVVLDNVSLPAGGGVAIAITRGLNPGASHGAQFSVSAAAFAPPAANESVLGNNQGAWTVTVQNSQPPTISSIPNQSGNEDSAVGPIAFTASDVDDVLTTAALSCASSNPALIDAAGCAFAGSEPNFTLTLTPKPDANGNATITVTVTDGASSADAAFQYTVAAVNDPPNFTLPSDRVYPPGTSGIRTVSSFLTGLTPGGGPDENGQTVQLASISLLPGSAPIFGSGGEPTYDANENVLAFALNGTSGVATLRVRVEDDGGTSNGGINFRERDFTITVQAPSN